jgi:Putative MetA-pathway of phenol degradation
MIRKKEIAWLLCLGSLCHYAEGQELEPRVYAALPKNLNTIAVGYGFSRGNVLSDPSLPISDFKVSLQSLTGVYLHTFALANKLARVQVNVPFIKIFGKLQLNGHDTTGSRNGFGDARIRFGINLTGTPALGRKEFNQYTQKTIVGISLVTVLPTGLYHSDKRINTGSNRWGLKPEIGISKRFNRVYAEAYAGVWFYSDNYKYLVDKTLHQQPVLSVQGHASYYFKNLMWVSINTTWFNGGKTLVDDVPQGDLLDNWRLGATWSVPIAKGQSLKFQFHVGAFTASGYDYNAISLAYQHIF